MEAGTVEAESDSIGKLLTKGNNEKALDFYINVLILSGICVCVYPSVVTNLRPNGAT